MIKSVLLEGEYISIKKENGLSPLYTIKNGEIEIEEIYTDDLEELVNVASIAQSLESTQPNIKNHAIVTRLETDLVSIEQTAEGLWSAIVNKNELGLEDDELQELVDLGEAILRI